jgi:hypothetical protein
MLIATLNIPFADHDIAGTQSCIDGGGSYTGAIGVIAATGVSGPHFLTLGNLDKKYCWRYSTASTFEVQFANKPAAGCAGSIPEAQWNEPSNDYTMLLLTAESTPSTLVHNALNLDHATTRAQQLPNSEKVCDSLHVSSVLCGQ